ncbi:MAG: hypothetical protein Q7R71_00145 [bacterium]|nr:hypothetical protein [bacterium]
MRTKHANPKKSLALIVERLHKSLAQHVDAQDAYPYEGVGPVAVWDWLNKPDLTAAVQKRLEMLYEAPLLVQLQQAGKLIDKKGRLALPIRYLVQNLFPFVPDLCDRKLFAAFIALAPAHLR